MCISFPHPCGKLLLDIENTESISVENYVENNFPPVNYCGLKKYCVKYLTKSHFIYIIDKAMRNFRPGGVNNEKNLSTK